MAGLVVQFKQRALEQNLLLRHVKLLRLAGEKSAHDRVDLPSDDTFVRAGEASVAKESCSAGKNLLVRSLHMGVGADDGADLAIEHTRQSDFFGCGFRV